MTQASAEVRGAMRMALTFLGTDALEGSTAPPDFEAGSLPVRLLEAMAREPHLSNRELCERVDSDEAQVSRAAQRLVNAGLATKERIGRTNRWSITASGRIQIAQQFPPVSRFEGAAWSTLTEAQLAEAITEVAADAVAERGAMTTRGSLSVPANRRVPIDDEDALIALLSQESACDDLKGAVLDALGEVGGKKSADAIASLVGGGLRVDPSRILRALRLLGGPTAVVTVVDIGMGGLQTPEGGELEVVRAVSALYELAFGGRIDITESGPKDSALIVNGRPLDQDVLVDFLEAASSALRRSLPHVATQADELKSLLEDDVSRNPNRPSATRLEARSPGSGLPHGLSGAPAGRARFVSYTAASELEGSDSAAGIEPEQPAVSPRQASESTSYRRAELRWLKRKFDQPSARVPRQSGDASAPVATHEQSDYRERFGSRTRSVIRHAELEARALGHGFIGAEHLFLGILADHGCLGARSLSNAGITYSIAREAILDIIGGGESSAPATNLRFAAHAKEALIEAAAGHVRAGQGAVTTGHLLSAIIEVSPIVQSVLGACGVDHRSLDEETDTLLKAGTSGDEE